MRQLGRKKMCKNCAFFEKSCGMWGGEAQKHKCRKDGHSVWHTRHRCDIPDQFKAKIETYVV